MDEKVGAVFIDRDGTVIRGILRPEFGRSAVAYAPWYVNEINFEPRLREAMWAFKKAGYLTVMATNQPDVAYGKLPKSRWQKIFNIVLKEMKPDHFTYCPHVSADNCTCRKPKPGMITQTAQDLNINLKKSWMIGDTANDMLAGKAAGCKTILIRSSYRSPDHQPSFWIFS